MSTARAAQTIESISSALNSGRVTSMPELVRIIQTISQDESGVSVDDLAALIQQDSSVLVKVITAANTLGYNPSGVKITTVSEAIHILGFNRVRRLAMSMLMLEHAGRSTTPVEQREMAALSLCSGLVAQVAAEQMTLVDPEEAFVCAALRNFGRLVLGTFMTAEFREARELADREGDDDEAYRTVFGLTPLELGYELLRSSALPEALLNAIRDVPAEILDRAAFAERRLAQVARFSLQLSELVLDPKFDAANFAIASQELVRRYGTDIPNLSEFFPDLLEQAEARLTKIARCAGDGALDRYGLDRLRRRVNGRDLPPRAAALVAPPAPAAGRPVATVLSAVGTEPGSRSPLPLEAATVEDAVELLSRDSTRRDATRIALHAMAKSLQASEAFFCGLDAMHGEFRLQHGQGPLSATLRHQALFRRHERNVFLLCHERLENVVVRNATDAKLGPYLPGWMRTADAPKAFILLPVHHQGRVHGVILIGWPQPQPIQISAERMATLRKLLALVALATLSY